MRWRRGGTLLAAVALGLAPTACSDDDVEDADRGKVRELAAADLTLLGLLDEVGPFLDAAHGGDPAAALPEATQKLVDALDAVTAAYEAIDITDPAVAEVRDLLLEAIDNTRARAEGLTALVGTPQYDAELDALDTDLLLITEARRVLSEVRFDD